MANPTWFNPTVYEANKVAQMNATNYDAAWLAAHDATEWTGDLYREYLETWGTESNHPDADPIPGADVNEKSFANFEACNGESYDVAEVSIADINVSGSEFFNVKEYCQNLADYANVPGNYPAAAPEGGWTAANVLAHMFNDFGISAWEHFTANWASQRVNPSASFDVSAYLAEVAKATGKTEEQVIADMGDSNPIMDFAENGASYGITTPPAGPAVTVPDFDQWDPDGAPIQPVPPVEDTDPFEQNVTNVAVTSTQTAYPGEGESYAGNTQFDAKWLPSSTDSTLNAKDVITGPEGTYNTLAVTLGKDWKGFNGVKQDDGTTAPSIENIGRVQLIHNPKNNEASYNFDAKNISDDAYRFDLDGASGPGSINLNNLSGAVNEIRISDLMPKDAGNAKSKAPNDTAINFVDGANTGKQDDLLLVVENVGANNDRSAAITSKNFGIENLTVQADKGDDTSYVDLSGLEGVKTLKVTGDGNINITDVATGIGTYDASEAKGNVNMAVVNPRSSTVVKGGEGSDIVTLSSGGSWTPAGLESIEQLTLNNNETVNLVNVGAGLTDLWGLKNGGTLKNLTADDFTVHLDQATKGTVTVNGDKEGSLLNVTFKADNGLGSYNEDATPPDFDPNLPTTNLSTNAGGTVTLTTGEEAKAFAIAQFNADNATELVVNAACKTAIGGWGNSSMKSVQNVTLNLENSSSDPANSDFTTINVDMPSAQNVTVNADGQGVSLQNLGTTKNDSSITLDVNDAKFFEVGDIQTSLGCNIDVDIVAEGHVKVGNLGNQTDVLKGNQGDIHLKVVSDRGDFMAQVVDARNNPIDGATFKGGPMTIDLGEVAGTANAGDDFDSDGEIDAFTLNSQGTINYIGAQGADNLKVTAVESGSAGSVFALGDGGDKITFDGIEAGKLTTVTVDLSDDDAAKDTITLGTNNTGHLLINVEGFDATTTGAAPVGHDVISGAYNNAAFTLAAGGAATPSNAQSNLADVLEDFGIINEATASIALSIGNAVTNLKGAFTYDGNVYVLGNNGATINATTVSNVTTLVCLGSVDDLANAEANCLVL